MKKGAAGERRTRAMASIGEKEKSPYSQIETK
jgi:hypothetical protein